MNGCVSAVAPAPSRGGATELQLAAAVVAGASVSERQRDGVRGAVARSDDQVARLRTAQLLRRQSVPHSLCVSLSVTSLYTYTVTMD